MRYNPYMTTTGSDRGAVEHDIYSRALALRRCVGDATTRVSVGSHASSILAMSRHLAEIAYGVPPSVTELVRRAMECRSTNQRHRIPPVPVVGMKPCRMATNHPSVPMTIEAMEAVGVVRTGVSSAKASPWVAALACHLSPDTIRLWPMAPRNHAIYCTPDPKQHPKPVSISRVRWTLDRGRVLGLAERDLRENEIEPMPEVLAWWNETQPIIDAAAKRAAAWFGW